MPEWELNHADRETLRVKLTDRIKQAARQYLLYTQGGGGSPAQNQIAWCTANIPNLDALASQLTHYIVSEPTFIAGGTSITDTAIQNRVESVINSHFMPAAE